MKIIMNPLPFRFFGFLACLALPLYVQADLNLNPLKIFSDKDRFDKVVPTQAEQKAAFELYQEGKEAQAKGSHSKALRRYKKITEDYPHTDAAPNAFARMGEIYRDKRRWDKSFDSFQAIIDEFPGYPGFDETLAAQYELASTLMGGARGKVLWVLPGFKNYDKAKEFMQRVYDNGPYSKTAPLALMNLAKIAQKQDDTDAAINALDLLVNNHSESLLAAQAHLQLADIYASLVKGPKYDQGSTLEAINYYEDFLILYPDSPLVADAEKALVKMREIYAQNKLQTADFYYTYRQNHRAALNFYNETITVAPESEAAKIAKAKIDAINRGEKPEGTFRSPFGQ
jgi:outer membrane protein assembly factor BamD